MTLFLLLFLGIIVASSLGWDGLIGVLILLGLVWLVGQMIG